MSAIAKTPAPSLEPERPKTRSFTLIEDQGTCEIWEGSSLIRTVPVEQGEAIVDLMRGYANFFIIK